MNNRRLLERTRNNARDIRVSDLLVLIEAFGYRLSRITGSHHIYEHQRFPLVLNLQPESDGKAKEYQGRV